MAASDSLNTSSKVTTGPVEFGSTLSGGGTVVFGTSSPGLTAAAANLTSNPWVLAGAAVVGLIGLYLYFRSRK